MCASSFRSVLLRWTPWVAVVAINAITILLLASEELQTHVIIETRSKNHTWKLEAAIQRLNLSQYLVTSSPPLPRPKSAACFDYRTLNLSYDTEKAEGNLTDDSNNVSNSLPLPPAAVTKKSLTEQDVERVRKFVFFVGYPRSGHSIVGSMMDAHPNMVIAHEYNLFRRWERARGKHTQRKQLYNSLYRNSIASALSGWRSKDKDSKGYTLGLDYPWQAGFTELKVIGDKSGAVTTNMFKRDPQRFEEILRELRQTTGVPVYAIHVVRSPFDMISTRLLYADSGKRGRLAVTPERPHCNSYGLSYHTNRTFTLIQDVQRLIEKTNLTVLDVHHTDLVNEPRETMSMVCRFLGLPCPADYLDACESKAYRHTPKSRLLVDWPERMIEEVNRLSKPHTFLWRYSFKGD